MVTNNCSLVRLLCKSTVIKSGLKDFPECTVTYGANVLKGVYVFNKLFMVVQTRTLNDRCSRFYLDRILFSIYKEFSDVSLLSMLLNTNDRGVHLGKDFLCFCLL